MKFSDKTSSSVSVIYSLDTEMMRTVFKSFVFYTLMCRLFPIYAALRAIKSQNNAELANWLCFYMFSEIWWFVENMLWFVLRLVPMYDVFRMIALVASLLVTTGYSPMPANELVRHCVLRWENEWPSIKDRLLQRGYGLKSWTRSISDNNGFLRQYTSMIFNAELGGAGHATVSNWSWNHRIDETHQLVV